MFPFSISGNEKPLNEVAVQAERVLSTTIKILRENKTADYRKPAISISGGYKLCLITES
jgi:hypothetical protein